MTPSFKYALQSGALLVFLVLGAILPQSAEALDVVLPDHVAFRTTSSDAKDCRAPSEARQALSLGFGIAADQSRKAFSTTYSLGEELAPSRNP